MRFRFLPIAAAAAALMLSGSAFAQRDGGGHHGSGDCPDGPPPGDTVGTGDHDGPGGHDGMRRPGGRHGLVPFWRNVDVATAMGLSDEQIGDPQLGVENVLFTCGNYVWRDDLIIPYAAADSRIFGAKINFVQLVDALDATTNG